MEKVSISQCQTSIPVSNAGGARVAFDKIACTGGSGRLGRFVVNRLAGKCEVTIVDLEPPGISAGPNVRYVRSDVVDYEALKAAFKGQDAVVHLAAIHPDQRSVTETDAR